MHLRNTAAWKFSDMSMKPELTPLKYELTKPVDNSKKMPMKYYELTL